ncbi:tRNA (uracil(54)-C(5))-methyltransferase [Drechslerella dactyloides]|uniref:tRNA (Uracil(54)-C(5))-methyltransferase n=1 Tax=Drechslerella dactyloides TaxID=74499 RepID=A0AAD6IUL2_DREDA|nr:tRNA (uracil(54)-C(5))-methyltransferase [Drechslerella dactyloides]
MRPIAAACLRQFHARLLPRSPINTILRLRFSSDLAPSDMSGIKRRNEANGSGEKRWKKKRTGKSDKKVGTGRFEGSPEDILLDDIKSLLRISQPEESVAESATIEESAPETFTEVEVTISTLTSTGDGLGTSDDGKRIYVVPFTVPGDKVTARAIKNFPGYTTTDLVEVKQPSQDRKDDLVFCKYFGRCSGCQFQMLSYDYQLGHKRRVIEKAMKNYSNLDPSLIPTVGEVMSSPLSQGYRTKLTPHFDGPRKGGFKPSDPIPEIGFQARGRRFVLDIEDCPIGTQVVRDGMKSQRDFVKHNLHTFKRGATLLLRESTRRTPLENDGSSNGNSEPQAYTDSKVCVTDSKTSITEYIDNFKFTFPAGSFFQNNNSILSKFTAFVSEQLDIPSEDGQEHPQDSYMIDAYCGSGPFSICCGHKFKAILGVDIASQSIESARRNAADNGIHNARFITGNAEAIFADVDFPPDRTSIVIDPPRKGCDELFLQQLLKLGPKRIVYISCNVHTMSRDIGWFIDSSAGSYVIEKVGGFDFFPQVSLHPDVITALSAIYEYLYTNAK